ncbi:MAG: DUF1638 domain-containing protein [Deltaproteobacteria bacterium]|jgi:hypothetical protein|nr:DUF1638 domain-containing protein [Deltaproteobacteria bacterium]
MTNKTNKMEELGLVACDVVRTEFEKALAGRPVTTRFLEYSLHSTPNLMSGRIMEALGEFKAQGIRKVLLGYGLCSNGVVGVASEGGLVMPRCHDCIAMLLGSPKRYFEIFRKNPGTYFLTEGWIRNRGDPLSSVEYKYTPRMGEKKALRGMSLELANYKTFCFVNNGVGDREAVRERTKENCKVFKKEYLELESGIDYFANLLDGPHPEEDFLVLPAGERVQNDYFYQII